MTPYEHLVTGALLKHRDDRILALEDKVRSSHLLTYSSKDALGMYFVWTADCSCKRWSHANTDLNSMLSHFRDHVEDELK